MSDDIPWWNPPFVGTETGHLLGALDRQRTTFRYKAEGRGRGGLTLTVGASTMTLGGLLAHLAVVEDHYADLVAGRPPVAWDDLEWATAREVDPQDLYDRYDAAVSRAREVYGVADLDALVTRGSVQMSVRRILFDLLEEYGRHTGHADLLSEAVDGRVGEDPPHDWVPVGAVDDGESSEPAVPVFERRRMRGARFHGVDLSGADLYHVDLSGARLRNVDLSGVAISSADVLDVTITGDLRNVVVNEVDIAPLVDAELNRRDPDRALAHPTDADGFRAGWELLERRWAQTVEKARAMDPARLHESVDGEWSFVETLRHLVYASQAWVARGILGDPAPWHPLALPWDQAPDMPGVPRDREVRPSLDDVLAVRTEVQALVRGVVASLTDAQLDEERTAPDDGVWPWGTHTVRDCLSTTLNEEYEHRRFAERDLARVLSPAP